MNKEEAVRCRDLGADALRSGQNARAVKMFRKSLHLYPLPGVKALLGQAERRLQSDENNGGTANNSGSAAGNDNNAQQPSNNNSSSSATGGSANGFAARSSSSMGASSTPSTSASTTVGSTDGRSYTTAQVTIVERVLQSRKGGRGAHYRVLR